MQQESIESNPLDYRHLQLIFLHCKGISDLAIKLMLLQIPLYLNNGNSILIFASAKTTGVNK